MENGQTVIDINSFLVWLGGGGAIIAASWILERWSKYRTLESNIKMVIFFVIASIIGIGAYVVGVYVPQETLNAIAPYFLILATVFSYVYLGTAFHRVDKQDRSIEVKLTQENIEQLKR